MSSSPPDCEGSLPRLVIGGRGDVSKPSKSKRLPLLLLGVSGRSIRLVLSSESLMINSGTSCCRSLSRLVVGGSGAGISKPSGSKALC